MSVSAAGDGSIWVGGLMSLHLFRNGSWYPVQVPGIVLAPEVGNLVSLRVSATDAWGNTFLPKKGLTPVLVDLRPPTESDPVPESKLPAAK